MAKHILKRLLVLIFAVASIFLPLIDTEAKSDVGKRKGPNPSEKSEEHRQETSDELENIYRYNDIFIISGKPNTKVQLSFKLKILKGQELYVSYTQVMLWNLAIEESSPFKDIAFNPEFFYKFKFDSSYLDSLDLGLEHRSNGRDGLETRSFDRVFAELHKHIGFGDTQIKLGLRVFSYYDLDKTNDDIKDYTGVWQARISNSGIFDLWFPYMYETYFNLVPGSKSPDGVFKGSSELGLKLRVRMFDLFPYLLAEVHHGHSETLLDYNKKVTAYRIGFLL